MELTRVHWKPCDYKNYQDFLETLAKSENDRLWSKRIAQTNYPMLAIPATKQLEIAKLIKRGNYSEFFKVSNFKYGEEILIAARIISLIKDFNEQKQQILWLIPFVDSWEGTDTIKFKINETNSNLYFNFANELIKSDLTFGRRMGAFILLKLVQFKEFTIKILQIVQDNRTETEYYVNMCYAWIICESLIKQRNLTINFWKDACFNEFVNNKAISKCRDSFRISISDKELLKTMKK